MIVDFYPGTSYPNSFFHFGGLLEKFSKLSDKNFTNLNEDAP